VVPVSDGDDADADGRLVDRRSVLAAGGGLALLGAGGLAWRELTGRGEDADTAQLGDEAARRLAERYAPTLYFDVDERWFPTDPRPYERDDEPVVDGFTALNDYTAAFREAEAPPEPTAFYHAVAYEDSPLAVVQFWLYSAFDQFTTNFHWHDWEVIHVFVDREADEPQLFVASAHSRKVPNNEHLDPAPDRAPRVLPELGSHSSGLSLNEDEDGFQRVSLDDLVADITNEEVAGVSALAELRAAYGLPRDEGSRLPYVVPELDGAPLYDHERLPDVDAASLIDGDLIVRSYADLASPPGDLPTRETGLVFGYPDGGAETEGDVDVAYDLVPTDDIEHLTAFEGPQLSFEFEVPQFAEDRIAGHITTTGVPWEQPRYDNPAADVSDPGHRAALADRYDAIAAPPDSERVVASVGRVVESVDAPDGAGVATEELPIEAVALLESDPEAVPTFAGAAVLDDVPEGEHRLTVAGAGLAPHSESLSVGESEGPTVAGVEGEVPLVDRGEAVKLRVDGEESDDDLARVAVEDDFGGRLYDAPLAGRDAVYVHRAGAYTTEVTDADDEVGAFRTVPDPADPQPVTVENPATGKTPLARYVADIATETAGTVRAATEGEGSDDGGGADDDDSGASDDDGDGGPPGLVRALEAVADAADRAATRAAEGDAEGADQVLETVRERLARARSRLADSEADLPDPVASAVERRAEQATRRNEQALAAGEP